MKKGACLCQAGISALGFAWYRRHIDSIHSEPLLIQRYGFSTLTARLLAGRYHHAASDSTEFFFNALREDFVFQTALLDIHRVSGLMAAAAYLATALQQGRRIGIITDYDVDGATAAALFCHYLRVLGTPAVHVAVPERLQEGFGPNERTLADIHRHHADILIVFDCGSQDHALLSRFQGDAVIVVDHHACDADAAFWHPDQHHWLINPHRQTDEHQPYRDGCAAFLAFCWLWR